MLVHQIKKINQKFFAQPIDFQISRSVVTNIAIYGLNFETKSKLATQKKSGGLE